MLGLFAMFSKLRTGAKKAAGRHNRPGGHDEELDRPSPQRQHVRVTGIHGSASVDVLGGSASRASVVASAAPILPPIPRIASKASHHGGSDPTSPILPSIRPVDSDRTSPLSDQSLSPQEPGPLRLVRSLDQAKAGLQADKTFMDATLMPPPPRPRLNTNSKSGHSFQRSLTDLGPRPSSSQTASSRASSTITEVPSPYRLQEPDEWVTPVDPIQLGSQAPTRPKSRLTKLNPFSYLNRKKSGISPTDEIDNSALAKRASFISPVQPLSDEFDPRIKGKGVHDFSAPKPSHFVSVQNLRSAAAHDAVELPANNVPGLYDHRRGSDSNLPQRPLGDPSPERKHVTVFKEEFDTSAEGWRLNPEDRRNQASSDIVDRVAALEKAAKDEKRKSSLPAFAVHMPEDIPSTDNAFHTPKSARSMPKSPQEPDFMPTPNSFNSIQQTPDSLKPPKGSPRVDALTPSPQGSPLADRSRAASPDGPQALSSLPKRLRSKTASIRSQASRFSFDMAGGGSAAQEKLLEEKHRQRAAQRARATSLTSISINEEEGFDEDDIDYGDDMEDDIPGMNDDEYGFRAGGVANMTLENSGHDYEEEVPGMTDEFDYGDEHDAEEGDDVGLGNMTLDSFKSQSASDHSQAFADDRPRGLGLQTMELDTGPAARIGGMYPAADTPKPAQLRGNPDPTEVDNELNDSNDGFYFDDGEFGGEFADEDFDAASEGFDENLLDHDFRRGKMIGTLRPQPTENAAAVDSSGLSTRPDSVDSEVLAGKRRSEMTADTSRTSMQLPQARRSSVLGQHDEIDAAASLTQENLSAYHNALAYAANKAANQGRFERGTATEGSEAPSLPDEAPQKRSVSFNEPRTSMRRSAMPPAVISGDEDAEDEFNFDDSMDDEDIIAAANAEALENDDEGEYGSEFGFYASAYGSEEAQAFHGGWFGGAGASQLKRSHSGREAFQEPNLTPITERSEWSNRNSMISLAMHGSGISPGVTSPGGLPSSTPGLAQLADQMQNEGSPGDDMTLSALMKARRGAFGGGGSTTSLQSMGNPGGSRSGSPSLYTFQQQQGVSPLSANGSGIMPPPPLREEDEDEDDDRPRHALPNPMLTLQTQNLTLRPTTSGSDSSPRKRNTPLSGRNHGHSRNSSGAESVSYAMHKNEEGDEMWVVERRRTLDNGDVEVVNRDYVHGTL